MKKPTVLHKKKILYPISLHYLSYDINYGRIRPPVYTINWIILFINKHIYSYYVKISKSLTEYDDFLRCANTSA